MANCVLVNSYYEIKAFISFQVSTPQYKEKRLLHAVIPEIAMYTLIIRSVRVCLERARQRLSKHAIYSMSVWMGNAQVNFSYDFRDLCLL